MISSQRLKSLVNWIAAKYGYKIEKSLDISEHELDIFELLIERVNPHDLHFFFIQVGANDGRTGDPIHAMVKRYHWRGILVELIRENIKRLEETYKGEPQLILENAAIAAEDGHATLWTVPGSDGVLATFDKQGLRDRLGRRPPIVAVPVRAMSIATLLAMHHVDRVDLLAGCGYKMYRDGIDTIAFRPDNVSQGLA